MYCLISSRLSLKSFRPRVLDSMVLKKSAALVEVLVEAVEAVEVVEVVELVLLALAKVAKGEAWEAPKTAPSAPSAPKAEGGTATTSLHELDTVTLVLALHGPPPSALNARTRNV